MVNLAKETKDKTLRVVDKRAKGSPMLIKEEYLQLMDYNDLPERFRAGDFGLLEDEIAILREFVDNFYAAVESNGCVTLEDFTEFMDFLCVLWTVDSEAVQNIVMTAFMKSAEVRNRLPGYVELNR